MLFLVSSTCGQAMNDKLKLFSKSFGSSFLYVSSSVGISITQFLSSMIILRFITPEDLGLWNTFLLIETYSLILQGGVINGINRELPFSIGQGNLPRANKIAATGLASNIFTISIMPLVLIVLLLLNNLTIQSFFTIIILCVTTSSKFYELYLISTFRSDQAFGKLSKLNVIRSGYNLVSVVFVVVGGYYGYLLRYLLNSAISFFYLHKNRPFRVPIKFSKEEFWLLIKYGFPIFILSYIQTFAETSDRLIVINWFSEYELGLYAFGLSLSGALVSIIGALASYFYPRMSFNFGKYNNERKILGQALKLNFALFFPLAILAILAILIIPWGVSNFFPKYIEAVSIAQLLMIGPVFISFSIGTNVFGALKNWKFIILTSIGSSFIAIFMPLFYFNFVDQSLSGVAIGSLLSKIASGLWCVLLLTLLYINTGIKNEEH